MKKTFTVTAFDAYDYTRECPVCSEYYFRMYEF